ncbi:energy transducer TonB [Tenacibaculum geojense]|uniref:Energy transducer TonB n=1 Tax=Tenacibaculum geojense TaxID=915352 RepID=A0ABW3JT09_9FLAO
MKKIFAIVLVLVTSISFAQKNEVCETPEESAMLDLNSITKCTIKPSKKGKSKRARQISVNVSASRRFLKKRTIQKKQLATGVDNLNTSGIANTNTSSGLDKSLTLKSNVAALKNSLSAEEVRMAEKFSTVDDLPSFASCKGKDKEDQIDCFNVEMIKHIQNYFSYPTEAAINKIEGEVWVRFIIDKDGNVSNIKTLGPKGAKLLNDEAARVVSNLPKFIPGVKDGKPTSVKYGFPINFTLQDN